MDTYIERLENLNRVMRHADPATLDMSNWCSCSIGHARCDQYFIDNFNSEFEKSLGGNPMSMLADYFGIDGKQAQSLFLSSGYHHLGRVTTPSDVVAKLEVILLAKRANEPVAEETGDSVEARDFETV